MATKNVHQPALQDAIDHFCIDCDPYGIMVSAVNGTIEKVYVDESEYTSKKLKKILTDNSDETLAPDLDKLKKAFLFPNATISQDRIKAALKEHKITLTNDYEQADLYLTHHNLDSDFDNGEAISSRCLFAKLWNYEATEQGNSVITDYTENTDNMKGGEFGRVILCAKTEDWHTKHRHEHHSMPVDAWLLSGMAINCAYNVEQGIAEVWDIEKVMNQSANKVILDEQLLNDLKALSSSYNDEDRNMIAAILPTIDYSKNYHLQWQLAQEIGSNIYNYNRNKDVQFWLGVSGFEDHYHRDALGMVQHLEKLDILDKISFRYLEDIVRKEIRIENRDLYTFRVELKPEYRKYLKQKNK